MNGTLRRTSASIHSGRTSSASKLPAGKADGDADRCRTYSQLLQCIENLYFATHSPDGTHVVSGPLPSPSRYHLKAPVPCAVTNLSLLIQRIHQMLASDAPHDERVPRFSCHPSHWPRLPTTALAGVDTAQVP